MGRSASAALVVALVLGCTVQQRTQPRSGASVPQIAGCAADTEPPPARTPCALEAPNLAVSDPFQDLNIWHLCVHDDTSATVERFVFMRAADSMRLAYFKNAATVEAVDVDVDAHDVAFAFGPPTATRAHRWRCSYRGRATWVAKVSAAEQLRCVDPDSGATAFSLAGAGRDPPTIMLPNLRTGVGHETFRIGEVPHEADSEADGDAAPDANADADVGP